MEIDLLSIFKQTIWSVLSEKVIVKTMAFLALSPQSFMGKIVAKLLVHLSEKMFEVLKEEIEVASIKLTNKIHQHDWERSQLKLRLIARGKGIDSEEFKKAREEEHEKLRKLVVYNLDPTVVRIGKAA